MTAVVLMGLRRSNWLNLVLVSVGIGALALFVVMGVIAISTDVIVSEVEGAGRRSQVLAVECETWTTS